MSTVSKPTQEKVLSKLQRGYTGQHAVAQRCRDCNSIFETDSGVDSIRCPADELIITEVQHGYTEAGDRGHVIMIASLHMPDPLVSELFPSKLYPHQVFEDFL